MKRLLKCPNRKSRSRTRPVPGFRPRVECLEDRLVPTVSFQPHFGAEILQRGSGPVLDSTPVYLIFEGHYWQRPTGLSYDDVINRVTEILASSYLSGLQQYGSNCFAYLAGWSFDSSMPTTFDASGNEWFSENDLQTTAGANMRNGLYAPSSEPLYFVVTAPGVGDATTPWADGYHNEQTSYYHVWWFSIPQQVPYGWTGVFGSTRAEQTDRFSQIFSHELAEAVSDPYPFTNPAVLMRPGKDWVGGEAESLGEIGDFEPGGYTYVLRLSNGAVVQPYWSNRDQAFIIPDGNAQTFSLTPHWANGAFQGT